MLSGFRATVFVDEGATLDEASIKTQLEEKGITLVSLETARIQTPEALYVIRAKGTT